MNEKQRILTMTKDVAQTLGRSVRYVQDMKRCGFRLPATQEDCVSFLRRHPRPSRSRNSNRQHENDSDE